MTEQERHIQLRQLITAQGESILEQKMFVNTLMDLGYFVDYANIRKVFTTIVEEGYSQKILSYAHGSEQKDSVFPYIIDGLQTKYCYDLKDVSYTLQSILYGIGIIDSVEKFDDVKDLEWLNRLNSHQEDNFDDWNAEYVIFNVKPVNSEIYVDYRLYKPTNGTAVVELGYGMHSYRVCAPMFHSSVGDIKVVEGKQKTINITLNPSYGSLEVFSNAEDGTIYLDGNEIGKTTASVEKVGSGRHNLEIRSSLYKTYNEEILIKDNEKLSVNAKLISNCGDVYIICKDSKASIYIDNKHVGDGSWRGKIIAGTHKLECKLESHYSYTEDIYVKVSSDNDSYETHVIPELKPFYGGIKINVLPVGCTVNIDGKDVGVTPFRSKTMLIGSHNITVTRKDLEKSYNYTAYIEQGKIYEIIDIIPDIFMSDLSNIELGNYLYDDGSYSLKLENGKKCIGVVCSLSVSDVERQAGWTHGHILALNEEKMKEKNWYFANDAINKMVKVSGDIASEWQIPTLEQWEDIFSCISGIKGNIWDVRFREVNKNIILSTKDDNLFWSSTEKTDEYVWCIGYSKSENKVRKNVFNKRILASVRCIAAF